MNTFGMKVSCACFVEYDNVDDLREIFTEHIHDLPQPMLHIGGGSNLLFTGDFHGTVFHSNLCFISVVGQTGDDGPVSVEVGAGVIFDDFCAWAAEHGLWGTENLSLIPGEVGASAVQNIGAYGVEVKDVISKVNCFDAVTGKVVTFDVKECRYAYRDSIFKDNAKGRYIVTSVVYRLDRKPAPRLDYGHIRTAVEEALGCPVGEAGERLTPSFVRELIISVRKTKLPDPAELGSAGSFFKNPVVPKSSYDKVVRIARHEFGEECRVPHYDTGSGFVKIPAAWLIEHCGWKGYREGNVAVYDRQPLVLVNMTGKAVPGEVIALENKIIKSVKDKFDIELHPEVEHID